jgi:hypothetical protein
MDPKRRQQPGNVRRDVPVKPVKSRPSSRPKFEQKARDPLIRLRELAAELRVLAAELDYGDAELDFEDSSSSSLSSGTSASSSTSERSSASSGGPPPPSSSSCDPDVWILSVAFSGGYTMSADDGTPYNAPQYVSSGRSSSSSNGGDQSPYLYVSGSTMSAKPKFSVSCLPTQAKIRGWGSDGINFPATNAVIDSGSHEIYPSSPISASSAFPSSTTNFYNPWDRTPNPFAISWEVSFDGGSTWESAGTSETPIFVSLAAPVSGVALLYTTVFTALYVTGSTTSDEAFFATWDMFAGPADVETWNGRQLYYYQTGKSFIDIPQNQTTSQFLQLGTGRCGTWQQFFMDCLHVNGITTAVPTSVDLLSSSSSSYNAFFVKSWSSSGSTGNYYNSTAFSGANWNEMSSWPGTYNQLTSGTGIPGQNTATPSEKFWGDHAIVRYGSTWYDPSYGVTYNSEADFQTKAIAYFGTHITGCSYSFVQVDSTVNIHFTPPP